MKMNFLLIAIGLILGTVSIYSCFNNGFNLPLFSSVLLMYLASIYILKNKKKSKLNKSFLK